jgi:gluconate 2-dehydrogenase gamma chain
MGTNQPTRRNFIADLSRAAAAGSLALELPWLATLAGCGRDAKRDESTFVVLTRAEARTMRALAAQIIPSDGDVPGAEEAGAVFFVDRALALELFAEGVPIIRAGLADLDARARLMYGGRDFESLSSSQQIAIMRGIEREPFFTVARSLVVIGTFSDPSHGGNKGGTGWSIVRLERRPTYATPYGWYDAQPPSGPGPRAA